MNYNVNRVPLKNLFDIIIALKQQNAIQKVVTIPGMFQYKQIIRYTVKNVVDYYINSIMFVREHGLGRPDILLRDRDNRRAMIIEAKRVTKPDDMSKACDEAVKQIIERKYAKGIPNGYRTILCYGVAFCEKDCLIKLLRV